MGELAQLVGFIVGEVLVAQHLDRAVTHHDVGFALVVVDRRRVVLGARLVPLIYRDRHRGGHFDALVELGPNPVLTEDLVVGHEVFAAGDQRGAPAPVPGRAAQAVHCCQGTDVQDRGADRNLDTGIAKGLDEPGRKQRQLGAVDDSPFGQRGVLALEASRRQHPVGLFVHGARQLAVAASTILSRPYSRARCWSSRYFNTAPRLTSAPSTDSPLCSRRCSAWAQSIDSATPGGL